MPVAFMLFYEQGNEDCIKVMDMLEELGAHVIPTDVYDDANLSLVESWNVCCVPTVACWPSYNSYAKEQITKEIILKELSISKE